MKKKKLVPKRRFKEFNEEWKTLSLDEVLIVNSGRDYKHLNVGNIPVYGTGGLMLHVDEKLSEDDSIGIGRKGTIDKPQLLKAPFWTVDTLFFMTPHNNTNLYFLFSKSQTIDWRKMDESTGVPSLSKNTIEKIRINMTFLKEQQKIGEFFKQLDQMITLEQRKLEKTKALKSAYLAEMFPAEGERVPKRRFVGFTGEWEEDILGNITDVRDGTHDSPKYYSEGHPFITSKNVKNGMISYEDIQYISNVDFDKINKRSKVDQNDILMGMIGTIGNIALVKKKPDFAIKNVALIKDVKKINYLYLYHYLESPKIIKQLSEDMDGGTQKFISLNKIRNLIIEVPELDEQIRVSRFFNKLDVSLTNQQQKLDKLKAMKQAYLQEMFV